MRRSWVLVVLAGCTVQDIGFIDSVEDAQRWCPSFSTAEYVAVADATPTDQTLDYTLPSQADGLLDSGTEPSVLTFTWLETPSQAYGFTVDPAAIDDLDEQIDARSNADLLREHALPDLPGCDRTGVLGPATVELARGDEISELSGTLVVFSSRQAQFWTEEVVIDFNGTVDGGEPLWVEQATGPDWDWVSSGF